MLSSVMFLIDHITILHPQAKYYTTLMGDSHKHKVQCSVTQLWAHDHNTTMQKSGSKGVQVCIFFEKYPP
jgi:hypothetical protein